MTKHNIILEHVAGVFETQWRHVATTIRLAPITDASIFRHKHLQIVSLVSKISQQTKRTRKYRFVCRSQVWRQQTLSSGAQQKRTHKGSWAAVCNKSSDGGQRLDCLHSEIESELTYPANICYRRAATISANRRQVSALITQAATSDSSNATDISR